jgi:rhamnulokinase
MMADVKKYIAVDLGAESGRVMLGTVWRGRLGLASRRHLAGGREQGQGALATRGQDAHATRIVLEEIHRFGNGPIEEDGSLRWDFGRLLSEIKIGIGKAAKASGGEAAGIGIDSWGVDFGLLDAEGKLIENPYHYRDSQTNGVKEKAFELISKREIYENTGLQFLQFNSVYQLLAMRLNNSAALAKAEKLIFIADLFSYFLCGKIFAEYSLASTSQFMDMRTSRWSKEILNKLSLPMNIMPEIVESGTVVGPLTAEIAGETGCGPIPVIAIGSHDTASAVVAVPAVGDADWAYLSSGTWSLMGVEVPQAIINDKTFTYEFTNEGGVENTIRLLKNIMGLWPIQECRRQWQREGMDLSYAELAAMAEKAEPFTHHIDVDYSGFLAPGDMPQRINDYLIETGQKPIDDKGQMLRAVLESLALKYRSIMEAVEDVASHKISVLHIVGGGIQNELLCQFTANALGKKVIAGPVEATASGNILMQAKATGQIKTLAEAREILRNSCELKEYEPQQTALWAEQYKRAGK